MTLKPVSEVTRFWNKLWEFNDEGSMREQEDNYLSDLIKNDRAEILKAIEGIVGELGITFDMNKVEDEYINKKDLKQELKTLFNINE